jgi:hypothetical protein
MIDPIQPYCATGKPFGELAKSFLTLAIFACEDKSEQKARILIAYEDGNFSQYETAQLIRTLGLASA